MDHLLNWHKKEYLINSRKNLKYFKNREIWWCTTGINIGVEENGKGENFQRPVLILKKYNKECFLGISLSTKIKNNKYYFPFEFKKRKISAILSQIKLYSSKRLENKIGKLSIDDFDKIKKAIIKLNF
jgi:mRNA interferase MazF